MIFSPKLRPLASFVKEERRSDSRIGLKGRPRGSSKVATMVLSVTSLRGASEQYWFYYRGENSQYSDGHNGVLSFLVRYLPVLPVPQHEIEMAHRDVGRF